MASYKKKKSGWQFRVSYKEDGKYRTKSGSGYHTKREAEAAARKVEEQVYRGERINYDPIFIDYMQRWYEVFKKGRYSATNDRAIENAIRVAKLFFKDMRIKEITRYKYQEFINWYAKDHVYSTVRKVHMYTKACLRDAFNDKVIATDPTYKAEVKGKKYKKSEDMKYLNEAEVKKLIPEIKRDLQPSWASRYVILIALATGMRLSEILGLTWDDIDFGKHTIRVNKSYDHVVTHQIKDTKTPSSIRTIAVDSKTLALIKQYKLAQQLSHPKYLFIDGSGTPSVSDAGCNKALKRACDRAGVRRVTMHSLRHTHCSLLIYKGFNIKYISKRLGHSDISVTYSVYGHIIDEMADKQNAKIEAVMSEMMS